MPALEDDTSGYAETDDGAETEGHSTVALYVAGFVVVLLVLWFVDVQTRRRCRRSVPNRPSTPPGTMLNSMTLAALPNDIDTDIGAISDSNSLGLRLIDESKAD